MFKTPNLTQSLTKGLNNKQDEWDDRALHISDLSAYLGDEGNCPRSLWLRVNGYKKKPLTLGKALMFDHGHRIHDRIADLLGAGLPAKWVVKGIEQPVSIGDITGRYDIKVAHVEEEVTVIVDVKTARGKAFGYLEKQGPKPSHQLQVRGYSVAEDAAGGVVFYIDREGQNGSRQFKVERDDRQVWEAIKYIKWIVESDEPMPIKGLKLEQKVNKGPDSVKLKEPWQCSYCDFKYVSCPGPIDEKYQPELGKIIGYLDGGQFNCKTENKELARIVAGLLDSGKIEAA